MGVRAGGRPVVRRVSSSGPPTTPGSVLGRHPRNRSRFPMASHLGAGVSGSRERGPLIRVRGLMATQSSYEYSPEVKQAVGMVRVQANCLVEEALNLMA